MTDTKGRREAAERDASRIWHVLDAVLLKTREACDALEGNGLDDLADEFNGLVARVEEAHAEAEKAVMED